MPYFNLIERFFAPYRRFRAIEGLIEREIDLPGIAIVPLKTAVRAQPRLNWSKGWVSRSALEQMPRGDRRAARGNQGAGRRAPSAARGRHQGHRADRATARRRCASWPSARCSAVLSGHVHDPFDIIEETANGPVRMIGAGTLSQRAALDPAELQRADLGRRDAQGRARATSTKCRPATCRSTTCPRTRCRRASPASRSRRSTRCRAPIRRCTRPRAAPAR